MSRWIRPDSEVKQQSLYMRGWLQTEEGKEYKSSRAEYARQWRKDNHERFLATQRRAYQKSRLECLVKYSQDPPCCKCCGEAEIGFLTIDHTAGDGAEHRRKIGMGQGSPTQVEKQKKQQKVTVGGNGLPYWLKKNNWPEGFQVLCANCNFSKRAGKYCIHEIRRGTDMSGNPITIEEPNAK